MIFPYKKNHPKIHPSAFVAPGSHVIGRVVLAKNSSVWFGAVLRGDIQRISIGESSNIQDNAVLHVDHDQDCILGKYVTVGHQATVHGCHIGDCVLVGIGATILSGAKIGSGSLIGAGAVVLENAVIPKNSLVLGVPAKVVRKLSVKEIGKFVPHAKRYATLAKEYKKYLG